MANGNEVNNLREQVVERLRSEIVSGARHPGLFTRCRAWRPKRESQRRRCAGPPRAQPRRARHAIAQSGISRRAHDPAGSGKRVSLRVLLERFALVALAERRLTDTAPLVALADAVAEAVKRDDVPDYIETDRRFHEGPVSRANNTRLTKMIMALRGDMRLYGIDTAEGRVRQRASVGEHYQMIEYASAGDSERIAALITKHIMEWKPLFVAALIWRCERAQGLITYPCQAPAIALRKPIV